MGCFRSFAVAALTLAAPLALAHHSPAAYDPAAQVAIVGAVTDFEWANPHAYLSVKEAAEAGAERVWLVELVSPSVLKQYGWSPTTLAVGDEVSVTALPGRNRARNIGFLLLLEKSDKVLLDMRSMVTRIRPPADGPRPSPPPAPPGTPSFSATSLSGTWATQPGPALGQLLEGAAALPATPKGAAAIRDFTDTVNPGRDCVQFPAPLYMILPVIRSIEVGDEAVVIKSEEGNVERIVHMNRTTHDGAVASLQGDSIGRWDGGALVVDTTHFTEHRLGNAAGLPSGSMKHVVERFELMPGGSTLTYSFTLDDREYLTTAVQSMSSWAYRPDIAFAPMECNLDNARRFLGD